MGAGRFAPRACAARRCIKARESLPPDTATTNGPSCFATIAAKRCSSLLAAGGFAEAGRLGEGLRVCLRIFGLDEAKRGAAFRFLSHAHEGLGELEHSVGRA